MVIKQKSYLSLVAVLFLFVTGCNGSGGINLSLESDRNIVDVSVPFVEFTLMVQGADGDPVAVTEIELAASAGVVSPPVKTGINHFSFMVTGVTATADPEMTVLAEVRGARAQKILTLVASTPEEIVMTVEPALVSADAGTSTVRIDVRGAGGYPVALPVLELGSNSGMIGRLKNVGPGTFEAVLNGLHSTAMNPVVVYARAGDVSAETGLEVLVGAHTGFVAEVATLPVVSNIPAPLRVMAVDRYGNHRSAYTGNVALTARGDSGEIPILPASSNTFTGGLLDQEVRIGSTDSNVFIDVRDGAMFGEADVGQVLPQPVRCIEVRREGIKSRIFTADEGGSPEGVLFKSWLYTISCAEIEEILQTGGGIVQYATLGVEPLVYLVNADNKIVGRSDVAGSSADDFVDDLIVNAYDKTFDIVLKGMNQVEGSPFQLIVAVGKISGQVQVEIAPGAWASIDIDRIPDQIAGPIPFGLYLTAIDSWGNQVFTETSEVLCDYANGSSTVVSMPAMTLGRVANPINPPPAGLNTVRCWHGALNYESSSVNGVSNGFEVLAAATVGEFAVVLPGQNFVQGTINGTPDNQVAGVPFDVSVVALPVQGLPSFTGFDGNVYLASLFGALKTRSGGLVRADSPLSGDATTINGFPYTGYSVLHQQVVVNQSGAQIIMVNAPDAQALPVPTFRSNIGLLGLNVPQNISDVFQVTSGRFSRFESASVNSPQTLNNAFLLVVEAVDVSGNRVQGYNSLASLSDQSGTLSPATANFNNGLLQVWVTVGQEWINNTIEVTTGDGESAQTNSFDVRSSGYISSFVAYGTANGLTRCTDVYNPAFPNAAAPNSINHPIAPATSETEFRILIVARDRTMRIADFNWPIKITDDTGTIAPLQTKAGDFVDRCLDQRIKIGKAAKNPDPTHITLSWSEVGSSASFESNYFEVFPGAPDHVEFINMENPGPVIRNTGLLDIEYKIVDSWGNTADSFAHAVTITDQKSALNGPPVVHFTATDAQPIQVSFDQTAVDDRIDITHSSSNYAKTISGQSNKFDVIVLPDAFALGATSGPVSGVTAYKPFELEVTAMLGGSPLPEFNQPVDLSVVDADGGAINIDITPTKTGFLSNGSTILPVTLRGDVTAPSIKIRATYTGPGGLPVTGDTESFGLENTAYVNMTGVPGTVQSGSSFTVHLAAMSSENGGDILASYSGVVEFVAYSAIISNSGVPLFETVYGCVGANTPSPTVTVTPNKSTALVAGALDMSVRLDGQQLVWVFDPVICFGAHLPGSGIVDLKGPVTVTAP